MAVVKALTADRMLTIEASSVTGGTIDANGDLILTTHGGELINAGRALGFKGDQGDPGMPAGTVSMWTASTVPDGWMEADGRLISRTEYPDLFAVTGTRYGTGDGSTTFALPDLRGRVVVGQDTSDVDFSLINNAAGEKNHLLTVSEMPAHSHRFTYQGNGYSSWPLLQNATSLQNVGFAAGDRYSPDRPIGNESTGGSQAHNNLQPYRVLKYIIKVVGGMGTLTPTVETALSGRIDDAEIDISNLQNDQINRYDYRVNPVFQARMAASQSLSGVSSWVKIVFATELVDRGNCYSTTNSRFTAPVAGVYEFDFSVTPSTTTAGPGFGFRVNGVGTSPLFDVMGYYDAYKTVGARRQFTLNAGDYVEVWWTNNNDTACTLHSGYGGLFSGKRI